MQIDRLMSSTDPSLESALQHLREVRQHILNLHKALLHSERAAYEQLHGRISSSGEFFRLVTEHEWFNWLRPISQFIIQMDDVLQSKQPVTIDQINPLFEQARDLLQPSESGTDLQKRYYQAIQRDPDIASMHAEVSHLLKT